MQKIKFTYEPPISGERNVFLTGDFNDWNSSALKMSYKNGVFQLDLLLESGKYQYKFIVDGNWISDQKAKYFVDDGFGGNNSQVVVKKSKTLFPAFLHFSGEAKMVQIVGDMNNWNPQPLIKIAKNKFAGKLLLEEGNYEYKFILNQKEWTFDEQNSNRKNGNSLLKVCSNIPKKSIYEIQYLYEKKSFVTNLENNNFIFELEYPADCAKNVFLILDEKSYKMKIHISDKKKDFFKITLNLKKQKRISFYFRIERNSKDFFYVLKDFPSIKFDSSRIFRLEVSKILKIEKPNWAETAIIYQIFTDRFRNANQTINPDFSESYYEEKNFLSEGARNGFYNFRNWKDDEILSSDDPQRHYVFYGGDLLGVELQIPYLLDLGINLIYFNPLVQAESNHKYDGINFFKIDPHFGSNEDFVHLVKILHKNNIKIIVDFAFNHVSSSSPQFQDCVKNAEKSPFWNWFEWKFLPLPQEFSDDFKAKNHYQCWWGHSSMPDLSYDLSRNHPQENEIKDIEKAVVNKEVVDFIMEIISFWLEKMGIDGFRLDVPNEVPFWLWELFRKKVKQINPEAILFGEIWHNAKEWINEKYFHSVMNYNYFREPVVNFFGLQKINSYEFCDIISEGIVSYDVKTTAVLMNLISSHDTHRFLKICNGDFSKMKLSVLFQMTFKGIPHIFYGDEIGMTGGNDPDNRRPFNFDFKKNSDFVALLNFYKNIIRIRKQYSHIFQKGDFEFCVINESFFYIIRKFENEKISLFFNNSQNEEKYYFSQKVFDIIENRYLTECKLPYFSGKIIYQSVSKGEK